MGFGLATDQKWVNSRNYAIDLYAPLVYNARMIFVETKVFTRRILDAMSDEYKHE